MIQWGKKSLQQMTLGQLDFHLEKNKVVPLPHPAVKINLKCIKELNIKAKNYKTLRCITKTWATKEKDRLHGLHQN